MAHEQYHRATNQAIAIGPRIYAKYEYFLAYTNGRAAPMATVPQQFARFWTVNKKTQTRRHLDSILPECIAEIAEGYLLPSLSDDYSVAMSGYWELCERIIDHNSGLLGACEGGYLDIARLMISYGANNFRCGLYKAIDGGHVELARLIIAYNTDCLDGGLFYACIRGQIELARLMIAYGAKGYSSCLAGACRFRKIESVKLMIAYGAKKCEWCDKSLEEHMTLDYSIT